MGRKIYGRQKTSLYRRWMGIRQRCYNHNNRKYKYYGGRGIKVCDEWKNDFLVFKKWAENNGYEEHLTIERKDVNGNYCPENCCWIPHADQAKNTTKVIILSIFGERKTLQEWIKDKRCKVSEICFYKRIKRGIDPEKALTNPKGISNVYINAFNETKTLEDWSRDHRCSITSTQISNRIKKGLSPELAISLPNQKIKD